VRQKAKRVAVAAPTSYNQVRVRVSGHNCLARVWKDFNRVVRRTWRVETNHHLVQHINLQPTIPEYTHIQRLQSRRERRVTL